MSFDPQVQAAAVAAATSLLVLGGEKVWSLLSGRREEKRQTRFQYLYPLKLASDDLLEYWSEIFRRHGAGDRGLGSPFLTLRDTCCEPTFFQNCNDYLCGPVGTLYATACYFAHATRVREQLPLVRISQRKALRLLHALDAVRVGLGGGGAGAFWIEIQENIGRLVTTEQGGVLSYARFCEALARDRASFFRLFNFYVDVELKIPYQLAWGYDALRRLQEFLERILETPHVEAGARTPASPAEADRPRRATPKRRAEDAPSHDVAPAA